MTKAALKQLEVATGFRTNPHGLVMSMALEGHLDLPDSINYDWVHSALQQGVLTSEVEAILEASVVPRSDLQAFLADATWEYPGIRRQKARYLHRVFDPRRVPTDDQRRVKASCSELLGLYGLLRCFFNLRLAGDPDFAPHLASFNSLCTGLDMILSLKRGLRRIDPRSVSELEDILGQHLTQHVAVYGDRNVRPKHHWLLDCPQQFLRDAIVLDAFVIERGHLDVKAIAELVKNTRAYERSVLTGVLCNALQDSRGNRFAVGLVGRTAVVPGGGFVVADRAAANFQEFAVGEMVVQGDSTGMIKACAEEAGDLFFLVLPFRLLEQHAPGCGTFAEGDGLVVWEPNDVCHALAWRHRSDGSMFVVCR